VRRRPSFEARAAFDARLVGARGRDKLATMSDEADPAPKRDVLFVHSKAESGEGYRVLRARDEAIEVGELRPAKEGQPLHGELVSLRAREGQPRVFDVDVLHARPKTIAARSGPAKVASDAYRAGWDAVFGAPDHDDPSRRPN
jgi:hypothetical protein